MFLFLQEETSIIQSLLLKNFLVLAVFKLIINIHFYPFIFHLRTDSWQTYNADCKASGRDGLVISLSIFSINSSNMQKKKLTIGQYHKSKHCFSTSKYCFVFTHARNGICYWQDLHLANIKLSKFPFPLRIICLHNILYLVNLYMNYFFKCFFCSRLLNQPAKYFPLRHHLFDMF